MQGTVNKINFNGKAYSAEVSGAWYGAGFDAPVFNEGDVIEFDVVTKGKFSNLAPGVKVVGSASTGSSPSAGSSGGAPAKNSYADRDISIGFQSSRKDALAFVGMAVQAGAVKLPTKQSDQLDALQALVDDYTVQFYVKLQDVIAQGGVTLEDLVPTQE